MRATSTPTASMALLDHRYGQDGLWARTWFAIVLGLLLTLAEFLPPAGPLITLGAVASAVGYRRAVDQMARAPSPRRMATADVWLVIHTQVVGGALCLAVIAFVVTLTELS